MKLAEKFQELALYRSSIELPALPPCRLAALSLGATLLFAGIGLTARSANSQAGCTFGTDALSDQGICCPTSGDVVEAQVPDFPALTIDGIALEFNECRQDLNSPVAIYIGTPQRENCDHFRIPILISTANWTLTGSFRAKYCRTWMDFDGTGACRQRWRFLLNTDVSFSFDDTNPPPLQESFVPWCVASGLNYRPHYTGHLDYQCVGSSFEAALALHHLPGCIAHSSCSSAPYVSPAWRHLDRSYHIVGPLPFSFADPGVASAWPFPMGGLAGDTVRESRPPWSSYECLQEAQIARNTANNRIGDDNGNEVCVCVSPPAVLDERRWTLVDAFLNYDCNDSGVISNITDDIDPASGSMSSPCSTPFGPFSGSGIGIVSMRVGSWTGGAFAGESVHIFFGRVYHQRYHADIVASCIPMDPSFSGTEVNTFVHGVMTTYGATDFGRLEPFSPTLSSCATYSSPRYGKFLDLANIYVADPLGGTADSDAFGVEFYSWISWGLNPNAL